MNEKSTATDIARARYLALQRLARVQRCATAELVEVGVVESVVAGVVRQHEVNSGVRLVRKVRLATAQGRPRRDLRTIGLENWKGCSGSRELGIVGFWLLGNGEIELGRVNVLIGENCAAKANLLEVLAFAAGLQ